MKGIPCTAGRSLPLVFDGAMGTELMRVEGSATITPTNVPLAYLTSSGMDAVCEVMRKYCEAGSDIVCTATYNVCDVRFARDPDEDVRARVPELPEILRKSVEAGREVVQRFAAREGLAQPPLVAAVIGPYGTAIEAGADYDFDYDRVDMQTLVDFHRRRTHALLAGQPDILIFETIPSLKEVRAIAQMLSETVIDAPCSIWLSCACRVNADTVECTTSCGDSWEETVKAADAAIFQAVGVNCTWPPYCQSLLQAASQWTEKPLVVYPNNGTWSKQEQQWLQAAPEDFATTMDEMCYTCNADPTCHGKETLRILAMGGCCCVGPADIRALALALRSKPRA